MDEDGDTPKRVLIKISGEALGGEGRGGFSQQALSFIAEQIAGAREVCPQIGLVLGAGNLVRGGELSRAGMDRVHCDQAGMVGTVLNALILAEVLNAHSIPSEVYSAFAVGTFARPFAVDDAQASLDAGRIALFAGGTGNPLFTTDSAAALRAVQTRCTLLMKATKVDGIFAADPKSHPDAEFFPKLTFQDVIERRLEVMDLTAFELCRAHGLPIRVFNFQKPGIIARILGGSQEGSLVTAGPET